jgi:hypothetical protein
MVYMRPDSSQAIRVMSRFRNDPGNGHWQAMKWILQNIQDTIDIGLVFERDESLD